MFKSTLAALAVLLASPSILAAETCVTIYGQTLTDAEARIAAEAYGTVRRYPVPENGVIKVCDGQENAFRQSLRETAERRADGAWRLFLETGGESGIIAAIERNAGSCPSILDDLNQMRPSTGQPFEVTCTNRRSYRLTNWGDERNWTDTPALQKVVVEEISR